MVKVFLNVTSGGGSGESELLNVTEAEEKVVKVRDIECNRRRGESGESETY